MQKGFSAILILVGLAAVIVVAGGLFYVGRLTAPKDQLQSSVSVIQSSPSSTITPTYQPSQTPVLTDETVSWKTYTSTKAGYYFKYPTEWPLNNQPESPQCTVCVESLIFSPVYNPNSGDNNTAIILVFKESNIKSLDDYVNVHVKGDQSKVDLKYTTIGGVKAVSYKLSGGIPPLPVIEYTVVKNGFYYIIRIDDSVETNKNKERNVMLFNEMLSTFKFTP